MIANKTKATGDFRGKMSKPLYGTEGGAVTKSYRGYVSYWRGNP